MVPERLRARLSKYLVRTLHQVNPSKRVLCRRDLLRLTTGVGMSRDQVVTMVHLLSASGQALQEVMSVIDGMALAVVVMLLRRLGIVSVIVMVLMDVGTTKSETKIEASLCLRFCLGLWDHCLPLLRLMVSFFTAARCVSALSQSKPGPIFRNDDLMQVFRNAVIPSSTGIRPRSPPPARGGGRPPPDYSPYQGPNSGRRGRY